MFKPWYLGYDFQDSPTCNDPIAFLYSKVLADMKP